MAFLEIQHVKIAGISACIPEETEENLTLSLFDSREEAEKFILNTGVEKRRISKGNQTTSDLCGAAAEKLIADLGWEKNDIDLLVFVSQTADYMLPATSCILQEKLGLSQECHTLDITLGCSGWVYGLSVVASLLGAGKMKKALLLCGDTSNAAVSREDKSTYPLFGECGSATALVFSDAVSCLRFHLATDGGGYKAIMIPDGRGRNPYSEHSSDMEEIAPGIKRNKVQTILNGMDVFSFGISEVPKAIEKLSEKFKIDLGKIDYFLLHQANKMMNEKIRKKLKLSVGQVPYSLNNFGNTSSASIPLTMVTELSHQLQHKKQNLIACGFGVGLSWATIAFETDKIVVSDLIEI